MNKEYIPKDAIDLIKLMKDNGHEAYLVGGCVRDMIMGVKPKDFDICTSAKPNETKDILKRNNIFLTDVGIKFGTVVAHINKEQYEITTYRQDIETSSQHRPDKVSFDATLENDLARRDFSINAMAFDPINGILVDKFNGEHDIKNKVIRSIREQSFKEDPLRILRALRFAITLGFDIEQDTFNSMIGHVSLMQHISKERITAELRKILTSGKDIKKIFMQASPIVCYIIPELKPCIGLSQNNKYHKHDVYEHILYVTDYCRTTDFEIKLAALLHDIGKPKARVLGEDGYHHYYGHEEISAELAVKSIVNNLRLTTEEESHIVKLIKYHDMELKETTKSVKRAIKNLGVELMPKWFILKQADRDDHIYPDNKHFMNIPRLKEIYEEILESQACLKITDLQVDGKEIMEILGIKPSKKVGYVLHRLFDEVINEELENTKELLRDRVIQISTEEEFKNINN